MYTCNKFKCLYVSSYYSEGMGEHKTAIWTADCQKLFPWLHVSAVSLLSKKGLRYLLYPFISLWIVGGRISPSFTSALSMELSNNLRRKAEKGKGGGKQKHRWLFLSFLLVLLFFFPFHQVYFSSQPPRLFTQHGSRLSSKANLAKPCEQRKERGEIKIEVQSWKMKKASLGLCSLSRSLRNILNRPSFFRALLLSKWLPSWGFFPLLFLNSVLKGTLKCEKLIILLAYMPGKKKQHRKTHCNFPSAMWCMEQAWYRRYRRPRSVERQPPGHMLWCKGGRSKTDPAMCRGRKHSSPLTGRVPSDTYIRYQMCDNGSMNGSGSGGCLFLSHSLIKSHHHGSFTPREFSPPKHLNVNED